MAFNYSDSLTTDLDKVRFYIQDTIEDGGAKPGDDNFSDAEINAVIAAEGSWERAVAALFDALASAWRKHQTFQTEGGLRVELGKIADAYAKDADRWWQANGGRPAATIVIGYRDTDNSGEDVSPIFQRESFGNKFKDWDAD